MNDIERHAAAQRSGSRRKAERQDAILAELRAAPAIRIAELAAKHRVTTETIRRDLDELGEAGLINRTYGGATVPLGLTEPGLDERVRVNRQQKQAIAIAVAGLVRDDESLMIDAGATTIYIARRLAADRNRLNVITNGFEVAAALATNPTMRVRVAPGEYDAHEAGVTGPDTLDYLAQFHVSRAIVGASRLDAGGPSDFNAKTVSIKRTMLRCADQSVLALESPKLARAGFERICSLEQLRTLVTDQAPPSDLANALRRAGVTVTVASEGA